MLYLLAILLPPLAFLACGKPFQAILSLTLMITLIGWIPAGVWAVFVVSGHLADRRNEALIRAIEGKPQERKSFRLSR